MYMYVSDLSKRKDIISKEFSMVGIEVVYQDINKTRQSDMANTSPRHMPVLGNVHPHLHRKFGYFFVTSFLCSLEFLYY